MTSLRRLLRQALCACGWHPYQIRIWTWVGGHPMQERFCPHCGYSPTWNR